MKDQTGPADFPRAAAIVTTAAIILPAAFVGYALTTFLFAFSGGQSRMVIVVNVGALSVIAVGVIASVVAWMLRPPGTAVRWTAIATGAGWITAILAEWLISFWLGA